MDCCVVLCGAEYHLTTRPGIGRLDFRGKVCCIRMIWTAAFYWVGQFLFNKSAWAWESGLQRRRGLDRNDMDCCVVKGGAALYFNNSAWGWDTDFRGRLCRIKHDMVCCCNG